MELELNSIKEEQEKKNENPKENQEKIKKNRQRYTKINYSMDWKKSY